MFRFYAKNEKRIRRQFGDKDCRIRFNSDNYIERAVLNEKSDVPTAFSLFSKTLSALLGFDRSASAGSAEGDPAGVRDVSPE